jgi:hypothetical protein
MKSIARDDDLKRWRSPRELFGVTQLKVQVGQATRLTHLFGKRERSGSEIEAHNLATRLCERGSNVTGTSRDIQDACPRMRANGLNESSEAIWIFDKRTRCVCLRLLCEFLAHHCFVIGER